MNAIVTQHQVRIRAICLEHKVSRLFAFGSVTTRKFDNATSDIDLIVELHETDPIKRGELLMNLWDSLEDLFERSVDLISTQPILNPYLKATIDQSKVLIYDGSSQEVFI